MKKTIIMIFAAFLMLSAGSSFAAEGKKKKPPIDITSDSLEATGKDIFFIGNVKAVYGEMKINADKVQLFYEEKRDGEEKKEVRSIIAEGKVEVMESKRHAWADKMVYERATGIATLTGNPKIKQDENTIAGDLIKIFVDEDRVEIKGNVRAVVEPETKEGQD